MDSYRLADGERGRLGSSGVREKLQVFGLWKVITKRDRGEDEQRCIALGHRLLQQERTGSTGGRDQVQAAAREANLDYRPELPRKSCYLRRLRFLHWLGRGSRPVR